MPKQGDAGTKPQEVEGSSGSQMSCLGCPRLLMHDADEARCQGCEKIPYTRHAKY